MVQTVLLVVQCRRARVCISLVPHQIARVSFLLCGGEMWLKKERKCLWLKLKRGHVYRGDAGTHIKGCDLRAFNWNLISSLNIFFKWHIIKAVYNVFIRDVFMHRKKKNNWSNDDVFLHSCSCFTYNVSNTSIANMRKGGDFFQSHVLQLPPLCTISDSHLSYLNMRISRRHQKPQEEATHYYILFVVPLPPHSLSMQ